MTKPKASKDNKTTNSSSQKPATNNNNNNNDVERQHSRAAINNPYSSGGEPHLLPPLHPINILKRSMYIGCSGYGVHKLGADKAIFHSPTVSHEWFKIGLAGTIAILFVKAYVELYAGKLQGTKVNYKNFPQCTHAALILILLTSIAFHVALWPHFGATTFLVLFLVGVILLQTALLIPAYLQNLVSLVVMTFFLQEYK